ncbi:hypothetical protein SAMN04489731_11410 [Amycolatopsis regifaucium]|nr:hypothetical protein SAMN04489731_11410 [Amycolatopsis regifaucium]
MKLSGRSGPARAAVLEQAEKMGGLVEAASVLGHKGLEPDYEPRIRDLVTHFFADL